MSASMMGEHSPCGLKQDWRGDLYMEDEWGTIELGRTTIDQTRIEQDCHFIRTGQTHYHGQEG